MHYQRRGKSTIENYIDIDQYGEAYYNLFPSIVIFTKFEKSFDYVSSLLNGAGFINVNWCLDKDDFFRTIIHKCDLMIFLSDIEFEDIKDFAARLNEYPERQEKSLFCEISDELERLERKKIYEFCDDFLSTPIFKEELIARIRAQVDMLKLCKATSKFRSQYVNEWQDAKAVVQKFEEDKSFLIASSLRGKQDIAVNIIKNKSCISAEAQSDQDCWSKEFYTQIICAHGNMSTCIAYLEQKGHVFPILLTQMVMIFLEKIWAEHEQSKIDDIYDMLRDYINLITRQVNDVSMLCLVISQKSEQIELYGNFGAFAFVEEMDATGAKCDRHGCDDEALRSIDERQYDILDMVGVRLVSRRDWSFAQVLDECPQLYFCENKGRG